MRSDVTESAITVADSLTITSLDHARWPSADGTTLPPTRLIVALDVEDGRLALTGEPGSPEGRRQVLYPARHPTRGRNGFPAGPVPRHLVWPVAAQQHLDAEQADALLEIVARRGADLLRGLVPIIGRGDGGFDWSVSAAGAARVITAYAETWWRRAGEHDEQAIERYCRTGLADLGEALKAFPELENPAWREMDDAELDAAGAALQISDPEHPRDRWLDVAHLRDDPHGPTSPVRPVGVLAELYRRRAAHA